MASNTTLFGVELLKLDFPDIVLFILNSLYISFHFRKMGRETKCIIGTFYLLADKGSWHWGLSF